MRVDARRLALRAHVTMVVLLSMAACAGGAGESAAAMDEQEAAAPAVAGGGGTELGTITATVGGQAQTWYMAAGEVGGRKYASGAWMETAPGERVLTLGGFETRDPPIESFEFSGDTPASFGDYTGSLMVLTIPVWPDRVPYTIRFPLENAGVMASVMHLAQATFDPTQVAEIIEGVMEVTQLEDRGGVLTVAGTFSGRFQRMEGDPVTITDGRFRGTRLPDLRTVSR